MFWLIRGLSIALIILIFLAGFGNAVLYLWNTVVPAVFGLRPLTYWQAVELLGLCWIFFGSWRALPRIPERMYEMRDQRVLRLSTAEEKSARTAVNDRGAK